MFLRHRLIFENEDPSMSGYVTKHVAENLNNSMFSKTSGDALVREVADAVT